MRGKERKCKRREEKKITIFTPLYLSLRIFSSPFFYLSIIKCKGEKEGCVREVRRKEEGREEGGRWEEGRHHHGPTLTEDLEEEEEE